ncbi:MAG: peptidylprolyl isomerase [Helicobacter sp.]|nr:peptidylprolyl isomerase [Helicobacter sp.]
MKKVVLSSIVAFALLQGVSFAKTFAKVNGEEVTEKDIAALMRAMPGVSYEQLPQEAKDQILNQAIERRLLIAEAKKEKVQNSKEFKETMATMEDDLMLEIWMRKAMDKVKVSEAEIKKFYDENKANFVQQDVVKARHILVTSESEAKQIIEDLKKAGGKAQEKFIELAKAKSRDGSAQNGGDLGWFGKRQMVPEFADAAFKLKKGTFSQTPVKTPAGFHIIYVEDQKPQRTLAYNEVKDQIEGSLKMRKFRDEMRKEGEKIRKQAKIEFSK